MPDEHIVKSGCVHNCPGRCVLKAHVQDGVIVHISSDDNGVDALSNRQLRACARGLAYRQRVYHPDRLKHPLIRTGARGSGRFRRASWDEALAVAAQSIRDTRDRHGNQSSFVHYGTGHQGLLNGATLAQRLLGICGGFLGYYGDYSAAAAAQATRATFGTVASGNSYDDLVNSCLIVLWGANWADTHIGTGAPLYLLQAKAAGAHIICIDPIYTSTAAQAHEWIPVYPGTDNALMDAMAFVMISEGLHDRAFLDKYCVGFDEAHLPAGARPGSSYESYVLGRADNQPRTPGWAEAITGVSAQTIVRLARRYATSHPAALIQGYGPQRAANGEQAARGAMVLAAMTGNVGISGGSAAGLGLCERRLALATVPMENPIKARIPIFRWTDAIEQAAELGPAEGLRGADRLNTNIRAILNFHSNTLVNQHADVNRTASLLRDTNRVEFILVSEHFLTPSARFADIVLPATTWFERNDVVAGESGEYALFLNKAIEPVGEARTDFWILRELAERLEVGPAFTEGRTEEEWLRELMVRSGIENFDQFKATGVYRRESSGSHVAFRDFRRDPAANPLRTTTGKIEIYSQMAAALDNPEVPAVPKYTPAPEGRSSDLRARFPLQLVTPHARHRTHSTLANVPWLQELCSDALNLNPLDASERGIAEAEIVRVWNDRGVVLLPAHLTERIMPGVVAIFQGSWYNPRADGVDLGGCANVLTCHRPTSWAHATTQHTALVEVGRA